MSFTCRVSKIKKPPKTWHFQPKVTKKLPFFFLQTFWGPSPMAQRTRRRPTCRSGSKPAALIFLNQLVARSASPASNTQVAATRLGIRITWVIHGCPFRWISLPCVCMYVYIFFIYICNVYLSLFSFIDKAWGFWNAQLFLGGLLLPRFSFADLQPRWFGWRRIQLFLKTANVKTCDFMGYCFVETSIRRQYINLQHIFFQCLSAMSQSACTTCQIETTSPAATLEASLWMFSCVLPYADEL